MLTTLDAVKTRLKITDDSQDSALLELIRAASGRIEGYCNRTFGRAEETDVHFPDAGQMDIVLKRCPVPVLTSIVRADGPMDLTAIEVSAASGVLRRAGDMGYQPWPRGRLDIRYEAGWILPGSGARDLPFDIEEACIDLVVTDYWSGDRDPQLRVRDIPDVIRQEWAVPRARDLEGGLPVAVAGVLDAYRLVSL